LPHRANSHDLDKVAIVNEDLGMPEPVDAEETDAAWPERPGRGSRERA
jgi:hypothetical protein